MLSRNFGYFKTLAANLATMLFLASSSSIAAVINVAPGDSYTKIESANPGDEVVIAPGTYTFRVYLTKQASPTNPITIRAQDALNRPIWASAQTWLKTPPAVTPPGTAVAADGSSAGHTVTTFQGLFFGIAEQHLKTRPVSATTIPPPTCTSRTAGSP